MSWTAAEFHPSLLQIELPSCKLYGLSFGVCWFSIIKWTGLKNFSYQSPRSFNFRRTHFWRQDFVELNSLWLWQGGTRFEWSCLPHRFYILSFQRIPEGHMEEKAMWKSGSCWLTEVLLFSLQVIMDHCYFPWMFDRYSLFQNHWQVGISPKTVQLKIE